MATSVEYILNLKDNLSKGLEGANVRAKELEGTLETVGKVVGVLGVSMAAFAGFEFLKGAHEAWEKLEQSTAKVSANLKSTGGAAGVGMDEIEEMATSLSSHIKATKGEVMDMQSQLLTFPSITKAIFKDSMGMVADIAAQTTHGLSETGIMFGKAFADPEKGLNKLVRYGVMLTEKEQDRIVKLEESGHLIAAQKLMLETIAHSGYEGVATEMFNADAGAQYEKSLYNVRIEVGELIDSLQRELMPVALEFLKWVKDAVVWIKKNKDEIISWVKSIGEGIIAFKIATAVLIPLVEGFIAVAPAAGAAAVGLETVAVAATASMGPLGLLAAAISAVVVAYNLLSDSEEMRNKGSKKIVDSARDDTNNFLNEQTAIYEKREGHEKAMEHAKQFYQSKISDERIKTLDKIAKAGDEDSEAVRNLKGVLSYENNAMQYASQYKGGVIPKKNGFKNPDGKVADKEPKTKATGSKSVTINVSIKDLIGTYNMNVTNIKEMGNNIREHVVAALVSATNDFQLATGQ